MFSIFLNKTGISSQFSYDNNGPPHRYNDAKEVECFCLKPY